MVTATQTRRLLIDIAKRRQRAGSGSSHEFLRSRTTNILFPDLSKTLEGIPWAVTGAGAVRLYMPERMTHDLDILVRREDSNRVRRRLESENAIYKGSLSLGGSTWILANAFPLDVIENEEAWVSAALNEAAINRDQQGLPVLPLPYLVLVKFRASRVQDIADISRMLAQATEVQLRSTRALFEQWLPKDIDDLESLIALGRLEFD